MFCFEIKILKFESKEFCFRVDYLAYLIEEAVFSFKYLNSLNQKLNREDVDFRIAVTLTQLH